MSPELDEKLCKKYPKIFKDRHGDIRQTLMVFGFECGDGWYNIIDALCSNIQWHIDSSRKNRLIALRYNRALKRALNGDMSSLEKYHSFRGKLTELSKKYIDDDMKNPKYKEVPHVVPQVVAQQVKEKFGSLRFYINYGDDVIYAYINMAESMSYRMCEVCGNPGKVYRDGWHVTLCPTHAKEQNREEIKENKDV